MSEISLVKAKEIKNTYKGRYPGNVGKKVHVALEKEKEKKRELVRIKKKKNDFIVERERVDLFLEEFLANGGNATSAAMKVFNCTSRTSAASIGTAYLKKARDIGRLLMEERGVTYGSLMDEAKKKMLEAKDPAWWDRLMKIAGYADFFAKKDNNPTNVVNIISAEKEILSKYVEEPEELEGNYVEEDELDDESTT